jgi:hypothetical protein
METYKWRKWVGILWNWRTKGAANSGLLNPWPPELAALLCAGLHPTARRPWTH